jgi:very-short-patch-repair endonuclease
MTMSNTLSEILNRFRERLLDITNRNKMVNSNFQARSKQHFRFIDEIPNILYQKLSKGMQFLPLPLPKKELLDENTKEFKDLYALLQNTDEEYLKGIQKIEQSENVDVNQEIENIERKLKDIVRVQLKLPKININPHDLSSIAKANNLNPDFELPIENKAENIKNKHSDSKIQTLMLPDELERYLKNIRRCYKNSLSETGVNPLYVCFGFLEWLDSKNSDKKMYAPLLMLQVDITENKKRQLTIISSDDEIMINQTLNEKLKNNFNLTMPKIKPLSDNEEYYDIEKYFKQVYKDIAEPNDWKIKRWASFGVYQAHHMPIYVDIDNIMKDNVTGLLESLFVGQTSNSNDINLDNYDIDSKEVTKEVPALICDADVSQYSAVIDAISGKNLVLEGPPGTGKSQTITNIIAALIAKGKKVLFVAQKQAALDVVRNRLDNVGLSDYLLEVFSLKANKQIVMESIGRRRDKAHQTYNKKKRDETISKSFSLRQELNSYRNIMASQFRDTDLTVHNILWDSTKLKDSEVTTKLTPNNYEKLSEVTETDRIENIKSLEYILEIHHRCFESSNTECLGIKRIKKIITNPYDIEETTQKLLDYKKQTTEFISSKNRFIENNIYFSNLNINFFDHHDVLNSFIESDSIQNYKDWDILKYYLDDNYINEREKYLPLITNLSSLTIKRNDLQNEISSNFVTKINYEKISECINVLKCTTIYSFFFPSWHKAHKYFFEIFLHKNQIDDYSSKSKSVWLEKLLSLKSKISDLDNNILAEEEKLNKFFNDIEGINPHIDRNLLSEYDSRDHIRFSELTSTDSILLTLKNLNYEPDKNPFETTESSKNHNDINIFKDNWLHHPEKLFEYYEILKLEKQLYNKNLEFFADLNITSSGSYNLIDQKKILVEITDSKVSLKLYMEYLQEKDILSKDLYKFFEDFIAYKSFIFDKYTSNDNLFVLDDIGDIYTNIIRECQRRIIYKDYPELSKFNAARLNRLIADFKSTDKDVQEFQNDHLIYFTHQNGDSAPEGIRSGKVGAKTDLGLIDHIKLKPKARVSIRGLIDRAHNAINAIKPCTLMSPLSVSQTLPLKCLYDVLIIDEASQMKPEYAIGAIARSKQVIIVGDSNQLPPARDFEARFTEEIDDDDDTFEDESILASAKTVFPFRRLEYHYRSNHEDLIRFSNAKFYDSKLRIPCTSNPGNSGRGIKHVFLDNAFYYSSGANAGAGGVNPVEAERIVDEAIKIMKERPDESLGIATMNIKQANEIENLIEIKKSKDPDMQKYLLKWEEDDNKINSFFVKSLANVQGDERDIIIVGTLFGPDPISKKRPPAQRFGPIVQKDGWRRLNVLFTRAKNELILVTSLLPSDINIGEDSSRGKEVFKEYLAYAETKILDYVSSTGNEPENPFEEWAMNEINSINGFNATCQIGSAGYKIDLGVQHEDYPYGYIMAVETDGATYHSSKSARDNDILRQQILEGHGWVFHRIWSTDWSSDPIGVKRKLKAALEQRLTDLKSNLKTSPSLK